MITLRPDRPRVRRVKHAERRTFAGTLAAGILSLRRGCWIRRTDKLGDVVDERRDERAVCRANVGSRLVVCPRDLEDDGIAVVGLVRPIEVGWQVQRWSVAVRAGEVASGEVVVMEVGR